MAISFNKIGDVCATFCGDALKGDIVSVSDSGTVAKASASSNQILGVCVSSERGVCTVQVKGFMTFEYTGASAPSLGIQSIASAGSNKVKVTTESNGRDMYVVAVDATAKTMTVLI